MKRFLLDREAAKNYLLPKRLRDIRNGLFSILLIFLYIYFYEHDNWLEYTTTLLTAFAVSVALLIGLQSLTYYLGIKKYADSYFFLDGPTLIHEWKDGKTAFLDLSIVDRPNSNLQQGNLVSHSLFMQLPKGIKDRDELLIEIHMAMEIYGDRSMETKTGLDRFWQSGILYHAAVFVALTIITQVGGIIHILSHFAFKKLKLNKVRRRILFIGAYLLFTLLIIPLVAPLLGRYPLPLTGNLKPLNYLTILLNRHYVKKDLKAQLVQAAGAMSDQFPGTSVRYLDANFPFISGFPLLPHLSHNDGKKVDLGFFYTNKETGLASDSGPSFIGYGVYASPGEGETNYAQRCNAEGYWQYGFLERLVPQWKADSYTVDVERTTALLKILLGQKETSKIFIEPHLKATWGLVQYDKVRFHGCQAVRHDDHIHLQIQ